MTGGRGLILQKMIGDDWIFIQTLIPIPEPERAAYLRQTYGRRASQFRIVEAPPVLNLRDDMPPPSSPVPSAATAIFERLSRLRT